MGINKVVFLSVLLAVVTAVVWSAASHNAPGVRAQANVWRSSGPMSTESFLCVVIDPGDSNTVYAGISQRGLEVSGVFKSVNGGTSWNPTRMSSVSVTALAIDPTRPNTIYAAADSNFTRGIYKSMDGGANWSLTGYRSGASSLAIDPKQPNTIYAGASSGGVYKSTDGGVTWSRPNPSFIHSFHSLVLDSENPRIIYGATQNNGVFKSADGGVTWNPTASITRGTSRPSLAIDPKNTSVLYAAYLDIYKTTNGGASWSKINNNLADPAASAVAIDPSNPNTVYIGTYVSHGTVYKSTNGGASWSEFNAGLPQKSVLSLVIDRTGASLHAGLEYGGVYDYQYSGASCTLSCSATAPATGTVNTPVAFTASATATGCSGAPSYDWDFGDNTAHSSQQNPTHVYSAAGTYTWRMTASVAGASACVRTGTITISVACTPPSITTQPGSQTISPGLTATLSVAAQGTAPLSYQWYRGQSGDTSNPVPGATGNSFTTSSLNATTSYWVRLSNACGQVNSGTATVTVMAPLQLDILDPACYAPLNCLGTFLDSGARGVWVTTDWPRLASANVLRDGAVTDGVTLLLLRVVSDAPISFTLKKPDGTQAATDWGTLRALDSIAAGSTVTTTPKTVNAAEKMAFAVYQTPINFPGDQDIGSADLMIEVAYANTAFGVVKQTIKLLRPPVVLMHGVWSDGGAWEGLERYLESRRFNVCEGCRPDYGTVEGGRFSAGSFDPADATTREQRFVIEQLIGATRWALDSYRAPQITSPLSPRGYAVTQVDVVGHSMGGLVARARASRKYEAVPYERVENYNRGDFHKIITVGSPHRGSPLVDILVARRCHRFILGRRSWTVEELLADNNHPIGPAIFGFQTASNALRNVGATNIPSHAIVGIAPDDSDTEDVLNWILKVFGNDRVDTLLLGNGNHDTIVPRYSQLGGLSESAASPRAGVVHANLEIIERRIGVTRPDDTGETASEDIWRRVAELLRADVSGEEFGNFTAFTSAKEPIEQAPCPTPNLQRFSDACDQ